MCAWFRSFISLTASRYGSLLTVDCVCAFGLSLSLSFFCPFLSFDELPLRAHSSHHGACESLLNYAPHGSVSSRVYETRDETSASRLFFSYFATRNAAAPRQPSRGAARRDTCTRSRVASLELELFARTRTCVCVCVFRPRDPRDR